MGEVVKTIVLESVLKEQELEATKKKRPEQYVKEYDEQEKELIRVEPYVTHGYPNLPSVQPTTNRDVIKRNKVGLHPKTRPPIFRLKQKSPPSSPKELEDQSRNPPSEYYLLKHFPALTVTDPHGQTVEASPSPCQQEFLVLVYEYEEKVYECTPYCPNVPFTPSEVYLALPPGIIIVLPPPTFKRKIYPVEVIKSKTAWTPPQGTPQLILSLYPS
uniref:Uncharacterized protein n=1 Tax=Cajanus cajan TaxID=3821 RepID=A0A151R6L5_CAJCA|nr:hypothetical protein KK1_040475 [Cajanus cajan]